MLPAQAPDPEITGWLHPLGVASLCQWDLLVFFARHQHTLLGVAYLARLLGYPPAAILDALDVLEAQHLVAGSAFSQGARLYQCSIPPLSPRGEAFAQLQALSSDLHGRWRVAQQLRRERTHGGTVQAAKHFLADAQAYLRKAQQRADELAARHHRGGKAL